MILKYISRAAAPGAPALYGQTAMEACVIDQWMDYCDATFVSGPRLEAAVAQAGEALALSTLMVGHTLSIADLCGWGKLQGAAMWMKVRSVATSRNVRRWFEFVSEQPPVASAVAQLSPKKAGKDAKVRHSTTTQVPLLCRQCALCAAASCVHAMHASPTGACVRDGHPELCQEHACVCCPAPACCTPGPQRLTRSRPQGAHRQRRPCCEHVAATERT
jgi:hypothetical protein